MHVKLWYAVGLRFHASSPKFCWMNCSMLSFGGVWVGFFVCLGFVFCLFGFCFSNKVRLSSCLLLESFRMSHKGVEMENIFK